MVGYFVCKLLRLKLVSKTQYFLTKTNFELNYFPTTQSNKLFDRQYCVNYYNNHILLTVNPVPPLEYQPHKAIN